MRILVATTSFPSNLNATLAVGGRFVLNECLAFEKAGATVEVIAPDFSIGPRTEACGERISVHRIRYFWPRKWQVLRRPDGSSLYDRKSLAVILQFPFLLLAFCLAFFRHGAKADVIHCNWSFTALAALPFSRFSGIPVVLTTRGSDLRLIPRWINRWVFGRVQAVIDCFGPDYRRLFGGLRANYAEMPVIVANPRKGDLPAELTAKAAGSFLAIMVGRFDEVKLEQYGMAFFLLLEATAELSERHDMRCMFVGDGLLRPRMETRALELCLEDRVFFAGYQGNVFPYLEAADVVLGGVGLNAVSQEASLLGKVQVMPRIQHWYENVWFDRQNVLLYEAGDLRSLVEALEYAIRNPRERQEIAENARSTGARYIRTVDEGGRLYLQLFRETARRKKAEGSKAA